MHTQAKRSWRRLARLAVARDELRAAKLKLVEAREEVARIDRELQEFRAAADAPDSDDDSDDSMLTQPPLPSEDFEITATPVAARTRSQRG